MLFFVCGMRGYLRSQYCHGVTLLKHSSRLMVHTFTLAMTSQLGRKLVAQKLNHLSIKKKVGRPAKARKKSTHEIGGPNRPRLTKHGVAMHCSHCRESTHNARKCERKKAGEPAVKKSKKTATSAVPDQLSSQQNETYQVCAKTNFNDQILELLQILCTTHFYFSLGGVPARKCALTILENPMVSQLQDEADQAVRQTARKQPTPDCAYITSNLPAARHMPLTTASKIVKATRVPAEKKKKKNAAKAKIKIQVQEMS